MKKYWYALFATLFLTGAAQADTGLWYNPERTGEGINLISQDKTLVVFFYTYRDLVTVIPPVVSPALPVQPSVCPNTTAWYIGQADNFDGETASGVLYGAEGIDYPRTVESYAGLIEEVGTFTLLRDGDGWILEIEESANSLVPWHASLYDSHDFPVPLLTK